MTWNINGLNGRKTALQHIQLQHNIDIITLTEPKANKIPQLNNFIAYDKAGRYQNNTCSPSGRALIYVKEKIHSYAFPINSALEAAAIKIASPYSTTICCIYLSPSIKVTKNQIKDLILQLGRNFILMGDFNAHHPLWGGNKANKRGDDISEIITELGLNLLSDKTPTFVRGKTLSTLDLVISSASLRFSLDHFILEDNFGSDHFPIVVTCKDLTKPSTKRKRYKVEDADWNKFRDSLNFNNLDKRDIERWAESFAGAINDAAYKSMKLVGEATGKKALPFWNSELETKVREKRKIFRRFKRTFGSDDGKKIKELDLEIKTLMEQGRDKSWRELVGNISSKVTSSQMWGSVRTINGKKKDTTIYSLITENRNINEPTEIANALATEFQDQSSDEIHSEAFRERKVQADNIPIVVPIDETNEGYNQVIARIELNQALADCKGSSPGSDYVHYDMVKHLTNTGIKELLILYNTILSTGTFPKCWKTAIVIPVKKIGKDPNQINSYRPISLLNVLGKLFERIIDRRFKLTLENKNLLDNCQTAFRRGKSTMDNLATITDYITEEMNQKRCVGSIFIDIKNAYNTVWRKRVIREMIKMGFKGNLVKLIQSFFEDRTFRVYNGNHKSRELSTVNGIPQGSVLSCTLFLIALNSILAKVRKHVRVSIYADDLTILFSHEDLLTISYQLHIALKQIQAELHDAGFAISDSKTSCMLFSRGREVYSMDIMLKNTLIKQETSHKLLGIILDRKLLFKEHIMDLKGRISKNNNVLRHLSGTSYGSDRKILLRINNALNISILDYGQIIYSQSCDTNLKALNVIQNSSVRMAIKAFRTTPVESLLVEAGQLPLARDKHHPLHYDLFNDENDDIISRRRKSSQKLTYRCRQALNELDIKLTDIMELSQEISDPWLIESSAAVNLSIAQYRTSNLSAKSINRVVTGELSRYEEYKAIYTDGSKSPQGVGASWVSAEWEMCVKLPSMTSIFHAELYAIYIALEFFTERENNILICTDSLSSLNAIKKVKCYDPLVVKIRNKVKASGAKVAFLWIPAHTGIKGNERADELAKIGAVHGEFRDIGITHEDNRKNINREVWRKFQGEWDSCRQNHKLGDIKPTVRPWKTAHLLPKKEEVIITRLRLGHTRLTHEFLISKEARNKCVCTEDLTVEHIFRCANLANVRYRFMIRGMETLKNDDVESQQRIINYIRAIKYYFEI